MTHLMPKGGFQSAYAAEKGQPGAPSGSAPQLIRIVQSDQLANESCYTVPMEWMYSGSEQQQVDLSRLQQPSVSQTRFVGGGGGSLAMAKPQGYGVLPSSTTSYITVMPGCTPSMVEIAPGVFAVSSSGPGSMPPMTSAMQPVEQRSCNIIQRGPQGMQCINQKNLSPSMQPQVVMLDPSYMSSKTRNMVQAGQGPHIQYISQNNLSAMPGQPQVIMLGPGTQNPYQNVLPSNFEERSVPRQMAQFEQQQSFSAQQQQQQQPQVLTYRPQQPQIVMVYPSNPATSTSQAYQNVMTLQGQASLQQLQLQQQQQQFRQSLQRQDAAQEMQQQVRDGFVPVMHQGRIFQVQVSRDGKTGIVVPDDAKSSMNSNSPTADSSGDNECSEESQQAPAARLPTMPENHEQKLDTTTMASQLPTTPVNHQETVDLTNESVVNHHRQDQQAQETASVAASIKATDAVPVSKAQRFKNRRDKDRPKRPLSAYNLYFKDERAKMIQRMKELQAAEGFQPARKQGHGISFEVMARSIATSWKKIDPNLLAKYELIAAVEKKRYKEEVLLYNKQRRVNTKQQQETNSSCDEK